MHSVHFDRKRHRLRLEASGFWDLAEALAFYTEVAAACRVARRDGEPIAILSDLTGYQPQGGEVSDTHQRTAAEIAMTPRSAYVLVTPLALNRMRLRRLLGGIAYELVDDRESALRRLGWSQDYSRAMPGLKPAPAPGTIRAAVA